MADKKPSAMDEIRAVLRDVGRRLTALASRDEEADQRQVEADQRQAKTDLQLQETDKQLQKTDKQLQKTSFEVEKTVKSIKQLRRQVGGQHNRWGKIVEDLVAGDLRDLLAKFLSIEINHVSTRVRGSYQSKNWEIDLLAVNEGTVVPVEVKTTLEKADIDGFIRRILHRLTDLIPAYRGDRVYGAIAFVKIADNEEETIDYALNKGLIVIKAMRGTNHIVNPKDCEPHDFHPLRLDR